MTMNVTWSVALTPNSKPAISRFAVYKTDHRQLCLNNDLPLRGFQCPTQQFPHRLVFDNSSAALPARNQQRQKNLETNCVLCIVAEKTSKVTKPIFALAANDCSTSAAGVPDHLRLFS
jgi:hypothetical protein